MGGGRLAATIVASPVLVWVRGRDVAFPSGTEATAFVKWRRSPRVDEERIRPQLGAPAEATSGFSETSSADRANANPALTNTDILEMQQAGVPARKCHSYQDQEQRYRFPNHSAGPGGTEAGRRY
jgi:hypothetical protein